jgi:hypothetical protein
MVQGLAFLEETTAGKECRKPRKGVGGGAKEEVAQFRPPST